MLMASNHAFQSQIHKTPPCAPIVSLHANGYSHRNGHSEQLNNHNALSSPSPSPTPPPLSSHRTFSSRQREIISVVGIPSVLIKDGRLVVGDSRSTSTRSYTPLKTLGDGSFGTVLLCDWHGALPPNTSPSPMQCGSGVRVEWVGKRLVAVKRMKKRWEGGWDECKRLKELESLRAIPFHPCIIPLYDFFLLPDTKELYFVFESMEGNLYHLIKARKGRPLAGGLVASIFCQIVSGLHHIHSSGYFHRDMKPENVLVTTTGLFEYPTLSPVAPPNAPPDKDVIAIIKLADFGLARETNSPPPYTEYVSTRWYRAPEVLLLSRDYSTPVDMWALGTIMAELVNLRPLFPGSGQIDQVARICEVLGDPCEDYGADPRGKPIGGGRWRKGMKMAKAVGFTFPKVPPRDFDSLFDRNVPRRLLECICDLLIYDPVQRLTSQQCLNHPYILETLPYIPSPSLPPQTTPPQRPHPPGLQPQSTLHSVTQANVYRSSDPPAHHSASYLSQYDIAISPATLAHAGDTPRYGSTQHIPDIQQEVRGHESLNFDRNHPDQMMLSSPRADARQDYSNTSQLMVFTSFSTRGCPQEAGAEPGYGNHVNGMNGEPSSHTKLGKFHSLGFGRKHSKWGLSGMFGQGDKNNQQTLPPLDGLPTTSSGLTPSLKRGQSSSSESPSLPEISPVKATRKDPKQIKKEAERLQREAEKQRRIMAERAQREQARAVMQKRSQMLMQTVGVNDIEWKWQHSGSLLATNQRRLLDPHEKGKQEALSPIRSNRGQQISKVSSLTVPATMGRYTKPFDSSFSPDASWRDERISKARRRDFDDDHSMSSSELHSSERLSAISFATVDSDPGPSRTRNRPPQSSINRVTSASSLRTGVSYDEISLSTRSSNILEQQFSGAFETLTSMDTPSSVSGTSSPPAINLLSLSPSPLSWMHGQHPPESTNLSPHHPSYMSVPQIIQYPPQSNQSFECNSQPYRNPLSAGDIKTAINPIFKVPPLPSSPSENVSSQALPPFSQLEAVAEGEYPPLSPMSIHTPENHYG